MTQEGKAVGKKLAPQQLAVSVSDGCAIITSALQCVYDHGRAGREGCDFLLMDMKNAYGEVLREAILRGLYEYAPHLVRWFIITYGSDTRLFHSLHGFVGWVKTGVKQGDPLSTLFFAVALQAALVEIDRDIATNHPGSMTARAMAFADDGIGVGDGASLLANLPRYERRILELTGLVVGRPKTLLVVSGGVVSAEVHRLADGLGIRVTTAGAAVLGAPVGSDEFIQQDIIGRVHQLTHDLAALAVFTAHDRHTLIRMCVNQRPVYLQRLLSLRHGTTAFKDFDAAGTEALLDTMRVDIPTERDAARDHVHHLRGLPLHLSGSNVCHISRLPPRVRSLILCRDNIARFHMMHAAVNGDLCTMLRRQWQLEQLPLTTIAPAALEDCTLAADNHPMWDALAGHAIGNIPPASVVVSTVSGDPDTSVTREEAKTRAAHHSFTADLALHTQALTCMRNSNQQHTQILAAQVLSSSCRHSGCVLQSLPIQGRAMADGQYVQLLRLRLGVPCVMPPAQWRCNCASHGGPRHSAYVESAVERAAEANQDDHQQQAASFATDPCHGLYCKRRWKRVMRRHDSIRDSLARTLELGLFKDVRATVEPRVPNPQTGADLRRGDIKVHQGGTTWILDIGVVCPGTQRYVDQGSQTTPGRAAEAYAAIKAAKYADQPNFVPFIVETGGYINRRAHLFLDTLRGSQGSRPAADSRTQGYFRGPSPQDVALRGVMQALVRIQAYMLADIVVAIPAVDLAIEAVV
jgi:hypothetical protein